MALGVANAFQGATLSNGGCTAITFDTQTVFASGFEFESGLLAELKQFKNSPVQIVVADVVVREIERHLIEKTRETYVRLKEANKQAARFGLIPTNLNQFESIDPQKIARERLADFLKEVGAVVAPSDVVALPDVLERYFDQRPPFSRTKNKEFPDAISLLALEHWTCLNGQRLMIVSGDGDWQRFAEKSNRMQWKEKLGDAIEGMLEDIGDASKLAGLLMKLVARDPPDKFGSMFREALEDDLQSHRYLVDVDSLFDTLRQETAELFLERFSERLDDGRRKVIHWREQSLAVEIPLRLEAVVSATFRSDSFQRSVHISRSTEFQANALVVFEIGKTTGLFESVSVDLLFAIDPVMIFLGSVDDEVDVEELWAS